MAKFSLLTALAIPLVPVAMFACGGDDGGKVTLKPDAKGSGSNGSGSGSQTVCAAMASYGAISSFGSNSYRYLGSGGSAASANLHRAVFTGNQADGTAVRVFMFGNCGSGSQAGSGCPFTTPTWPGQFTPVAGIDLATNFDVLVLILANLDSAANPPTYQDVYLAGAGTLNITMAPNGSGQAFAGNASNVETVHVDSTTFEEHPDGCQSSITSFSWTGSATANGKPAAEYQINDEALGRYLTKRHF